MHILRGQRSLVHELTRNFFIAFLSPLHTPPSPTGGGGPVSGSLHQLWDLPVCSSLSEPPHWRIQLLNWPHPPPTHTLHVPFIGLCYSLGFLQCLATQLYMSVICITWTLLMYMYEYTPHIIIVYVHIHRQVIWHVRELIESTSAMRRAWCLLLGL